MAKISRPEKLLSALAYLPFILLLSLIFERKRKGSAFLLFHVNQGLILFIVECTLLLPLALLGFLLSDFWYPLGTVVFILMFLLTAVFLILSLHGILSSLRAQMREIPIFNNCHPIKK